MFIERLSEGDQDRARELIQRGRPPAYWFQPEYNTTRDLLEVSPHDIHQIYKLFSAVTHGGFAARLLFDDEPAAENIEPREHPRNTPRAIVASARLLLEVCYVRDQWDNLGAAEEAYQNLLRRINAFREP
jgi:hypothetical protein